MHCVRGSTRFGSARCRATACAALCSAGPALGRSFRDAARIGDRLLVENSLSWAAARPAIVNVPEKPARAVGLALTEESLGEVLRYVLLYMPGAAALAGLLLLLRRRAQEKSSRQATARGKT